jgi:hypothetical protein
VNTKTSIVVPASQYELFCDALKEKTVVVEVHDEDLCRRAFPSRVIDKCTELYKDLEASASAQQQTAAPSGKGGAAAKGAPSKPAAAPPAGKKGAKAESAPVVDTKPPSRTILPYSGPRTEMDEFLIKTFNDAVSGTSKIKPHGTVRLRLEKMLETSPDILKRYEKVRQEGGGVDGKKSSEDAEHVTVSALYSVELRGAKAWKPDRWSIPDDLSLKKFIAESNAEKATKSATLVLPAIVPHSDSAAAVVTTGTLNTTKGSTLNASTIKVGRMFPSSFIYFT